MTEMAEGGMAATNRLAASGRPLLFADRQLSTHSRLSPAVRDGTAGSLAVAATSTSRQATGRRPSRLSSVLVVAARSPRRAARNVRNSIPARHGRKRSACFERSTLGSRPKRLVFAPAADLLLKATSDGCVN